MLTPNFQAVAEVLEEELQVYTVPRAEGQGGGVYMGGGQVYTVPRAVYCILYPEPRTWR